MSNGARSSTPGKSVPRRVFCLAVFGLLLGLAACEDLDTDVSPTSSSNAQATTTISQPSTSTSVSSPAAETDTDTAEAPAAKDGGSTTTVWSTPPTIAERGPLIPADRVGWTRFEETHTCMIWEGWWAPDIDPAASGGRCMSIDSMGYLRVCFEGTRIALVAEKNPEYGYLRLWMRGPTGRTVEGLEAVAPASP